MRDEIKNTKITLLIVVIGLLFLYVKFGFLWILCLALGIGILGAISKKARDIIDFLWMRLAWMLSLIVPNLVLAIVFYVVLFPTAILSKVFGFRNGVVLKNKRSSFYTVVHKKYTPSFFEKPW